MVACSVLLSLCLGCDAFDEGLLPDDTLPPGGCVGERPPVRPGTDAAGDDGNEYLIVLRDIQLDQLGGEPGQEEWRSIGFNQDQRCSEDSDNIQCLPIRDGSPARLDGNNGIDNTFGDAFFPLLELGVSGIDDDFIASQAQGIGVVAFRITGWNGEPNDAQVEIVVTQSVFATPGQADGSPPNINVVGSEGFVAGTTAPVPPPEWMGNDYFWMRDDTFIVDRPLVRIMNGYVSNGVITASVPDRTPILLVGTTVGATVAMTDLTAAGNLVELVNGGDGAHVDVTIAGRWAFEDMLATLETVGICPGESLFNLLTQQLEALVDVYIDPDAAAPDARCDGLSVGVRFQGYLGKWGGLAGSPPLPNPCDTP